MPFLLSAIAPGPLVLENFMDEPPAWHGKAGPLLAFWALSRCPGAMEHLNSFGFACKRTCIQNGGRNKSVGAKEPKPQEACATA